jgi:hypothetical protein
MLSLYSEEIKKQLPSKFSKLEKIIEKQIHQYNKIYILNNKFEPEHISSSPPNEFLKNLQLRMDIYYTPINNLF